MKGWEVHFVTMRKSRENEFSWPLHPYQYLSYDFFFYELLVTGVFLCPLLPPPYQVSSIQSVFIVLYVPLQVVAGLFGIFAIKSNHTDVVVYKHRLAKKTSTPHTVILQLDSLHFPLQHLRHSSE